MSVKPLHRPPIYPPAHAVLRMVGGFTGTPVSSLVARGLRGRPTLRASLDAAATIEVRRTDGLARSSVTLAGAAVQWLLPAFDGGSLQLVVTGPANGVVEVV